MKYLERKIPATIQVLYRKVTRSSGIKFKLRDYEKDKNDFEAWLDSLEGEGTDEEKYDREMDRQADEEFELMAENRENILEKWEAGWHCLFAALDAINEENFDTLVYIRNQGHTITEAINCQLTHYAYHVGQMVFIGKMIKGNQWNSLSIPKGKSKNYNQEKFSKPKSKEHFTREYIQKREKL